MIESIHSINSVQNIGLTEWQRYFSMTPEQFGKYIRSHLSVLTRELDHVGFDYQSVNTALIPSNARKEIALLFNVEEIASGFYGREINSVLIPLLHRQTSHCVLSGDILQQPEITKQDAKAAGLTPSRQINWGSQYIYSVYITNLSKSQMDFIHSKFLEHKSYLGFVDATYSSNLRDKIAAMLPTTYLHSKNFVLLSHDEDNLISNQNSVCFPFSESNLQIISVHSYLFSALLSYKIQSSQSDRHEIDTIVSLNAISDSPLALNDFSVEISEGKFNYLHKEKSNNLHLAGLKELTVKQLSASIQAQIKNGFLYKLTENIDGSVQFSVVQEFIKKNGCKVKITVGLKYFPSQKKLALVTMF